MRVGDIVRIYAPVAGYDKYHFCICIPDGASAGKFLFLNSDPGYRDCLAIDCARIPLLPPSDTGVTAISFSLLVRYNAEKLALYRPTVLGAMPMDVVLQMLEFLKTVRSLPNPDKAVVVTALESLKNQ